MAFLPIFLSAIIGFLKKMAKKLLKLKNLRGAKSALAQELRQEVLGLSSIILELNSLALHWQYYITVCY